MTAFVVPVEFSVKRAQEFLTSNNSYYFFVGDHRSANTVVADETKSTSDTYYYPWQQMIEGKKISQMSLAIKNSPSVFGKAYDQYDDRNFDPTSASFYAITNSGSFSHVFKCLYNNHGANSTVQPDFFQVVGANSVLYQTSDGYRWKYMYSVDSATITTFGTNDYFPLVANTIVEGAAIPGSINTIVVNDPGKGYDNYVTGTFSPTDIRVSSVPTLYQISNSNIKTANGFYTGCVLLITNGTGVGQYARVNDYVSTNTGNYANLDSVFAVTPTNGSRFEIYPECRVVSDSTQTVNCVARALVNALASNTVSSIEILNPGAGYFVANCSVVANSVVGIRAAANTRVVLPPRNGHGANSAVELAASTVMVSASLANSEGGLIPATNTFRQIGIVRNPKFANVNLTISSGSGLFTTGETALFLTSVLQSTNASANVSNTTITGDTRSLYSSRFSNGQMILVSNGTVSFASNIVSITNNSVMTISSFSPITSGNLTISSTKIIDQANVITSVSSANVYVSGLTGANISSTLMYGKLSGAFGNVSSISRNSVVKGFETFVQTYKYSVAILAGVFAPDEYVYQGNNFGQVHSFANNKLYVSNLTKPFAPTAGNITGNTSGAVATITEAFSPELTNGSGSLIYIENVASVERQPNETETFQIAYNF
jgi:hypothetical protein